LKISIIYKDLFADLFAIYTRNVHEKNNFAEGPKILLDTDLKIILLKSKNNDQCSK